MEAVHHTEEVTEHQPGHQEPRLQHTASLKTTASPLARRLQDTHPTKAHGAVPKHPLTNLLPQTTTTTKATKTVGQVTTHPRLVDTYQRLLLEHSMRLHQEHIVRLRQLRTMHQRLLRIMRRRLVDREALGEEVIGDLRLEVRWMRRRRRVVVGIMLLLRLRLMEECRRPLRLVGKMMVLGMLTEESSVWNGSVSIGDGFKEESGAAGRFSISTVFF